MIQAFIGATVIDGTGRTIPGAVVLVEDDRIVGLGSPEQVPIPDGALRHDVTGKTIIPGLIDCHVHVYGSARPDHLAETRNLVPFTSIEGAVNAYKCLAAGFTSLRDAGAPSLVDIAVKQAIERGVVVGPRMQVCGCFLSITGGHGDIETGWPPEVRIAGYTVVDGVDEARKMARLQLRHGADALKVGATGGVLSVGDSPTSRGLTEEEMRVVVEEGLNVGKKTLAHAQGSVGIANAIRAGVASIEHGSYLNDELIEMMLDRDVFLVPTLTAVDRILAHGVEGGIPDYAVEKAKAMRDIHAGTFYQAYRAGVKIALGTDAGTPFNLHGQNARELVLMVEAGMTPMDALIAATARGAELMDWDDRVGTLRPGKLADMVVLSADPLEDISILSRPDSLEMVVLGGRIVGDMVSS